MHFTVKIKKLSSGINKASACKAAGLSVTTISNYIAMGSIPRADIALKIAKALNVPLAWLVDDSADFPVPTPAEAPTAAQLSDEDLAAEVARRLVRQKGLAAALPGHPDSYGQPNHAEIEAFLPPMTRDAIDRHRTFSAAFCERYEKEIGLVRGVRASAPLRRKGKR